MKEFLDKLTSYNIFINLLPGIIFVVILQNYFFIKIPQQDILINLFIYYFVGLVINRIGSLIIEPLLIKFNFIKYAPYKDYLSASRKDDKIETFLEVNNTFRTLLSLLLVVILIKPYLYIVQKIGLTIEANLLLILVSIMILFLFSYKKQTRYIFRRIMDYRSKE